MTDVVEAEENKMKINKYKKREKDSNRSGRQRIVISSVTWSTHGTTHCDCLNVPYAPYASLTIKFHIDVIFALFTAILSHKKDMSLFHNNVQENGRSSLVCFTTNLFLFR